MLNACSKCRIVLTEENCCLSVIKRNRYGDGGGWCNSCRKMYLDQRRRDLPAQYILNRTKGGAKARGIEFKLELKDIPDTPEFCPVLPWIKLQHRVGTERERYSNTPSLE